MLDAIRSNTQSFWVKAAFAIIILVFVFWGIGSFTDTGNVNVVATVNDEPITYQQFETAYRNAEENINRQSPRKTWSAEEKSQLGRQVFQGLVTETLINQEAQRNGLGVSPYELRLYVGQMEIFQDDKGKFDPERYKNILSSRRQTPAQFESDLSRRLLQEKMVSFIAGGSWSDSIEARNRFNFLRQKRVVDYIYLPAAEAGSVQAPTDEEIGKYYEDHKIEYAIPHKVNAQYLEINPLHLVSPDAIGDDAARAWYDANTQRFEVPESLEVAHILVQLDRNASEEQEKEALAKIAAIQKELADGKDFAAVADAHNPPNAADKGGRVGRVTRGMTVPAFEAAAFAAEIGKVTEPVRSEFGYHLILVSGKNPASTRAFDDVKQEIKTSLAAEQGKEKLADVLDTLTEANILGRSLEESGKPFGLEVKSTGLQDEQEIARTLQVTAEGAKSIMAIGVNQPLDVPLAAGDKYVIVRVVESTPASFKTLDEVRADVVKKLTETAGLDVAKAQLEGVLKDAGKELAPEWQARVKTSDPVDRGGSMTPFLPQAQLEEAIFKAEKSTWLPSVFAVSTAEGSGALVARVADIRDPADQEWQQFEAIMVNLTQRERAEGLFQVFLEGVMSQSKVLVRNQDIIDRKNM